LEVWVVPIFRFWQLKLIAIRADLATLLFGSRFASDFFDVINVGGHTTVDIISKIFHKKL
jgi:hypothetical protein